MGSLSWPDKSEPHCLIVQGWHHIVVILRVWNDSSVSALRYVPCAFAPVWPVSQDWPADGVDGRFVWQLSDGCRGLYNVPGHSCHATHSLRLGCQMSADSFSCVCVYQSVSCQIWRALKAIYEKYWTASTQTGHLWPTCDAAQEALKASCAATFRLVVGNLPLLLDLLNTRPRSMTSLFVKSVDMCMNDFKTHRHTRTKKEDSKSSARSRLNIWHWELLLQLCDLFGCTSRAWGVATFSSGTIILSKKFSRNLGQFTQNQEENKTAWDHF